MVKHVIVALLVLLSSPLLAQQQDCDVALETRALRNTLAELIRVQVRVSHITAAQQRLSELREQHSEVAAELARLQTNTLTTADLQTLEEVNPAVAERERREIERLAPIVSDARRRITSLDQEIAIVQKEIERLWSELDVIERRLAPKHDDASHN